MATLLTLAAVAALAVDPSCGAAPAGGDLAKRLVAVAQHESGFDPLAINLNGSNGGPRRFPDKGSAIAFSRQLMASGTSFDAGLLQINVKNFPRHGLTVETAFDPCPNMRAGSQHLANDFKAAAWTLAHRRYNCGSVDCDTAYAAKVDRLVADTLPQGTAAPSPSPSNDDPSDPEPPRWDVFGHIEWEMRAADRKHPLPAIARTKEPSP